MISRLIVFVKEREFRLFIGDKILLYQLFLFYDFLKNTLSPYKMNIYNQSISSQISTLFICYLTMIYKCNILMFIYISHSTLKKQTLQEKLVKFFKKNNFELPSEDNLQYYLLSSNQKALTFLLEYPSTKGDFCYIYGGQGVGKTYTIKFIAEAFNALVVDLFSSNISSLEKMIKKSDILIFDDFDKYFSRKYQLLNLDRNHITCYEKKCEELILYAKESGKKVIFTSSVAKELLNIKSQEMSSIFNNIQSIILKNVSKADVESFIELCCTSRGIHFEDNLCQQVISRYQELDYSLLVKIVEMMKSCESVSSKNLKSILSDTLK